MSKKKAADRVREKPVNVNFKVTRAELAAIRKAAALYAGGNVSYWLRHAALTLKSRPKKAS